MDADRGTSRERPLRIVAFGGGTGLPLLLRGLRGAGVFASAVVTMADDGGSSGRLRDELGIAPPGDVRRCLVALAGRRRLAEVFDYRFEAGAELRDHSVGNLIIAALADISGGFAEGVAQAGRLLRIDGEVHPATTESVTLIAHHADGTVSHGESSTRHALAPIRRIAHEPAGTPAPHVVLDAVAAADAVVLSAGSLFTSTIASLLGAGVPDALAAFRGPVIYTANVMTQPGETVGFTAADHVRAIVEHVGAVVTDVVVSCERLPDAVVARYRAEGGEPVELDRAAIERLGVRVHETPLLRSPIGAQVRHDPGRLARAVCALVP